MKTTIKLIALLANVLMLAACNKESSVATRERDITYTVTTVGTQRAASAVDKTTTVHLETEAEWQALLDRFCDYAEDGSEVTFYNANHKAAKSPTKDATTFNTTDREAMKRWMAEMEDAGKTVTVTYNSNTGTWNGTAYTTAPQEQQEGCYTGVLVMHEFDQLISLQISTDSILIIFNNTTYYENGYIELDDTTYYVGDTVTLCGELVTVGPEDYWTMGGGIPQHRTSMGRSGPAKWPAVGEPERGSRMPVGIWQLLCLGRDATQEHILLEHLRLLPTE
jgi:thiamine biosynthesis lipoprotein ApbE